eukprot:s386_g37.t1
MFIGCDFQAMDMEMRRAQLDYACVLDNAADALKDAPLNSVGSFELSEVIESVSQSTLASTRTTLRLDALPRLPELSIGRSYIICYVRSSLDTTRVNKIGSGLSVNDIILAQGVTYFGRNCDLPGDQHSCSGFFVGLCEWHCDDKNLQPTTNRGRNGG